ncbi:alcohol oxidase [Hygrophoropsis aurantiaca]|uniref:Alcohol oxidase n=1 Tax=Hygrophoropsis aurantiaca TaxID=72124 RepID=A0ACB8A6H0_9AGAM|nr:alcohol oxidase [Hygrophoropsis aurantiaca]
MDAASIFSRQNFDYIVVGGGTTGLALASLLSTNKNIHVGVIEVGERKDDDLVLVPGMIGRVLGNPEYDWGFLTKPQVNAKDRQIPINRGKVLGGTSALNYMAYCRGSRIEFDDWEKLGIKGWDWETMRRVVNASEAWTPPSDHAKQHNADCVTQHHGRGGHVKTTAYSYYYDLVLPFFDTMNKLGVATNYSEASGDLIGIWTYTASIDPETRTRSYSTNAYYDHVSNRPNIVVLTGAQATKVLMGDREGRAPSRALGVEFMKAGGKFAASVRREVIICAGALQTPQLLELSGIGNTELLKHLNIPVKVDLPGVGENFQDHFVVPMGAELKGRHITVDDLSSPSFSDKELDHYRATRSGMLSSTLSTLVFIPTSAFISPDVMKSMLTSLDRALLRPAIQNSPYKKWYELQRSWLENDGVAQLEIILFPSYTHEGCTNENARHYTMSVFLQHAWSRGYVHAKSSSILDPPEIDPATLESPGDIDMTMLVEAVKYAFKIMQTGALGDLTANIVEPQPSWSDDKLRDYVRSVVKSALHPIGTASMLPRSANGVVDNNLKVYGTSNLRVADASIFPIHMGTHPQATLYGLAHRAAEIIQESQDNNVSAKL